MLNHLKVGQFTQTYNKAIKLLNNSMVLKKIKSRDYTRNSIGHGVQDRLHYDISPGTKLNVWNILSLLF